MIGLLFENTSGKRVQFPLRLDDSFSWGLNERIRITEQHTVPNWGSGYMVHNIDYCGAT